MPGILDIAPPEVTTETIDIRGTLIEVRGIRNRDWAGLLRRFPALRAQVFGITIPDEEMAVSSIEVMPAVIAAGLVEKADEVAVVERLSDAEQSAVFATIMRLTMPPAPLAESPAPAGQDAGPAETTSPTPSSN